MSEQLILQELAELKRLVSNQTLLQKPVLSFQEACQYLELSESYLYKLTSKKEIPHYCPNGKKLCFNRLELEQWLQRNRQVTNTEIEMKAATHVTLNKKS